MPSRRAYFATLAGVGLAGCVGSPSDPATDSSSDGTGNASSETATPADAAPPPDVDVVATAVQYSFRHVEQVD
jgi:nitrous oxide reductase